MPNEIWTGFAQNGPWAAAAAFLMWTILKAWQKDRDTVVSMLSEFKDALVALTHAVEKNTEVTLKVKE